jgi:hypothetical protein
MSQEPTQPVNLEVDVGNELMGAPSSSPELAPDAYPNKNLQDFWKTLWHVDVRKDHEGTYDRGVVNSFLPEEGKYETSQTFTMDGKDYTISTPGVNASRTGKEELTSGNLGLHELFYYLTNQDIDGTFALNIDATATYELRADLMGPGIKYDIKVFNINGTNLAEYVGNDIALFVDTTSHLPELLNSYINQRKGKIIYAYTREIESDPADKSTYLTIGKGFIDGEKEKNEQAFYYELEAPQNPTGIIYPPFEKDTGLSYFYCNYPVFLTNKGIKDRTKYTLDVELSYIKGDKTITVTEGANTAGALTKFKNGILKSNRLSPADDMREIVFISKHHGDVAQSLVKFRDVRMKCPQNAAEINTADYKAVFVSIDVNAIIKALTIGIPYVFMYPPDKDRIIVWKNTTLNNPRDQFESEKKYTEEQNKRLQARIAEYNDNIVKINENRTNYNTIMATALPVLPNKVEEYKELLKFGVIMTTLSSYIPKDAIEEILPKDYATQIAAITIAPDANDVAINTKLLALKSLQIEMSRKEGELKVPSEYSKITIPPDAITRDIVSFEKEVLLQFTRTAAANKYTLEITKAKKIENLWQPVNLQYNMGDRDFGGILSCRIGTKLNNSWGFDIINYIYSNLRVYKEGDATAFITKLQTIARNIPLTARDAGKPTKLETFNYGLDLTGIPVPAEDLVMGGRRIRRGGQTKIAQRPTFIEQSEESREQQRAFEKQDKADQIDLKKINALNIELDDMIAHLKFILDILYLYKFNNRLTQETYEWISLRAYDRFFKAVFGGNYSVDFSTISKPADIKAFEEDERKKRLARFQKGGYIELVDARLIETIIEKAELVPEGGLTSENVFTPGAKFLTTAFSPISYYKELAWRLDEANTIETRLEWYDRLRSSKKRRKEYDILKSRLAVLNGLIDEINKFNDKDDEDATRSTKVYPTKAARMEAVEEGARIEAANAEDAEAEAAEAEVEALVARLNSSSKVGTKKQRTGSRGGTRRRLRKYKTYKKSKKQTKKRTLKRFK